MSTKINQLWLDEVTSNLVNQGNLQRPEERKHSLIPMAIVRGTGEKFTCKCGNLKDFILDCGQPHHADVNKTEEILNYFLTTCKDSGHMVAHVL